MANFNKPELTSTYTNFITELKARDNEVASLFSANGVTTGSYPARAIRWNTAGYFERRNANNNGFERLEGNSGTHEFVNIETGTLTATNNASITGDVTVSDQLQAARVNVTGTTKPANGLYRPASNEIRFTTNSTDRFTIESNGQIGINNVNPAHTLDIVGDFRINNGSSTSSIEIGDGGTGNRSALIDLVGDTTYTDYGLRIIRNNSGANTSSSLIHRGTGSFIFEANEAADMKFLTSNTTRVIIDSGGAVCIGTDTSPDDRLHIKHAIDTGVALRIQNNDGYARFITDSNDLFIDADVQEMRSRDGGTDYLKVTSSLFDIKIATKVNGNLQVTGTITGSITGNAATATTLATARTIGGVSFNGSANINLPGVNTTGNQDTSGNAATATNSTQLGGKSLSASGNRWNVIPHVSSAGATEIGEYLDFHGSDGSTENHENRIRSLGTTGLSFDCNLVPDGNRDLGSSSSRWQNIYVNDLKMSNEGKTNDIDGTWGDYTIQEGHEDLYLINHRTSKKYKFALIPVA